MPAYILSFTGGISSIFAPQLTINYAKNNMEEIKNDLISSIKILGFITCIPLSIMYAYGDVFFSLWAPTQDARLLQNIFNYGFKYYGRAIGGMLLVVVFTFLWSLLFVIPGIVKGYSYALTPYILIDDPQISIRDAVRKSQRMMSGQKFNLFYLQLSFIGWWILSIMTGGIGFLWLIPYYTTSMAAFYRNLRDNIPA